MMIGYKITERGMGLLQAYIAGIEFIWIPGVNYDRLFSMASILNKLYLCGREGYISVDPQEVDGTTLRNISALKMDGFIENDILPIAGELVEYQDMLSRRRK